MKIVFIIHYLLLYNHVGYSKMLFIKNVKNKYYTNSNQNQNLLKKTTRIKMLVYYSCAVK